MIHFKHHGIKCTAFVPATEENLERARKLIDYYLELRVCQLTNVMHSNFKITAITIDQTFEIRWIDTTLRGYSGFKENRLLYRNSRA